MRTVAMADDGGIGGDIPGWVSALIAAVGGSAGLGGLWAWLTARDKTKVDLRKQEIDLVGVAQRAASDVIRELREDVDRARLRADEAGAEADQLRERVGLLEAKHDALSADHRALMLANETLQATNDDQRRTIQAQAAEIDALRVKEVQLTGELRQSKQIIESMAAASKT